MFYLRILFFILFLLELRFLNFKHKKGKYLWIIIVLIFSYVGYFFFYIYKRRLIIKREFNPNFKQNKLIVK